MYIDVYLKIYVDITDLFESLKVSMEYTPQTGYKEIPFMVGERWIACGMRYRGVL